jgi:[ribosomal protein S18]-alanine N-acetyltransferase
MNTWGFLITSRSKSRPICGTKDRRFHLAYRVRLMTKKDIPQVTIVDHEAFPTMWPPVNFNHELTNRLAHYIVSCDTSQIINNLPRPEPKPATVRSFLGFRWPFNSKSASAAEVSTEPLDYITGFVGMWLMVDEAHIINLAVREGFRGKGIGELLLISSIDMATRLKASMVTLEVRATNTVAQNLYLKYGFNKMGVRRGYYTDNKEDAFIMTTDIITSDSYRQQYQKLRDTHLQKITDLQYCV